MNSRDRRTTIAERLKVNREASIAELAFAFGTSEMTIRRDLELLEVKGLARRIRGGAISTQGRSYEPPILQRGAFRSDAKKRIGAVAAGLLHPDETVILDVGTTTLEMAKAIAPDLSLSVITSSLLIASELDRKPKVRTIVTGGVLRSGEMSLVGSRAEAVVSRLELRHALPRRRRCRYRERDSASTTWTTPWSSRRRSSRRGASWCWPTRPRSATWPS